MISIIQKRGVDRIATTIGKITGMVSDLEAGIAEIENDNEVKTELIAALQADIDRNEVGRAQAEIVRRNIAKLLTP